MAQTFESRVDFLGSKLRMLFNIKIRMTLNGGTDKSTYIHFGKIIDIMAKLR